MSPERKSVGRAEQAFRDAFDRLKRGKPNLLAKGTRVSQNNVAKEAGVDPSALKKARFPALVLEIQRWVEEHGGETQPSPRQMILSQRSKARDLRAANEALKLQRDDALSLLVQAEDRIVELTVENERMRAHLPASNVAPMRPAEAAKGRAKRAGDHEGSP
ncbi:MAG: hypothetical protein LKM32_00815 [Chiayiivirga sp.]|jgi:hypothetical protein|uniref:hypothetical protein n=1 Tax=Chiayiivirga sp. TaxID=2041042 RepID=UPI0025BE0092|nr:hypothetical protein [Chiayiivirga sp.]MCI1711222.1 hypothetical protein [Chiayiivirga sp.]MCI1727977.1 hypothetical protein [Chiayiivirga sp.]